MTTKEEAKRAVEAELIRRKLTKPMTASEVLQFSQEMYVQLEFDSATDGWQDIRTWVENWQAKRLR